MLGPYCCYRKILNSRVLRVQMDPRTGDEISDVEDGEMPSGFVPHGDVFALTDEEVLYKDVRVDFPDDEANEERECIPDAELDGRIPQGYKRCDPCRAWIAHRGWAKHVAR